MSDNNALLPIDKPLILIVDDDDDVRYTLERIMTREGYRTIGASNGQQAIDMALRYVPDLILLDIIMPGMDGVTAMKSLRTQPITQHIPIVILSAKGSTEDIVEGLKAGADDYIVKPFELAELRVRIEVRLRAGYDHFSKRAAKAEQLDRIFISYRHVDWDEYVKPLVARLEAEKISFWVDRSSIEGSHDWLDEINKALKVTKRMIVCISPDALESRYVKMEYRYAFNNGIRLYPLVCRSVDLPAELQTLHHYTYAELNVLFDALKRPQ